MKGKLATEIGKGLLGLGLSITASILIEKGISIGFDKISERRKPIKEKVETLKMGKNGVFTRKKGIVETIVGSIKNR